ncbi:hypothetical protein [Telluribacter sp.]|jgi:hypothetical protein|uniref:hypothetical protein n=1 Tax=Telluribacter sp. TaxID=1978767 RepID=UPI002E1207D4|nr:hypothetical protein [Telluribacter sp.]
MQTKIFLTVITFCFFGAALAQNFDKPTVKSKNQTYNVKKMENTVFLNNEKKEFTGKKPNYRLDTLKLSGLSWKEAQIEVTKKVKDYLVNQRNISLETLPNVFTQWYILKNGQIKEVTFMFPRDTPLTAQDFEEMEKIITQTKIEVTQPQFYQSVNFIPIHIPFIWKQTVR